MRLSLIHRVLTVMLATLAAAACSPPPFPPFETSDARLIAESDDGERLYVESDYFGENVYLVESDGASRFAGTNSAIFDYTFFGAISNSHLVWIVDDYDYPMDGAVHVVFFDRGTENLTRWDFELAPNVFPHGFFIWDGSAELCDDTLHWKQAAALGQASLDVWLSAEGRINWTELVDEEAERWSPDCSYKTLGH